MAELEFLQGRLSYRKRSTGAERGREYFWLTLNRDGSRTLRCLATTDDSRFVRDVTFTLGADERPAEAFVRLMVGERHVGSGFFRTRDDRLFVTTESAEQGRAEQSVPVPERFALTTHAVMLDGWLIWAYDRARGGEQRVTFYNTSTKWNGTDGPLGRLETQRLTLLGEEEVSVPAGRFRATHFKFDADDVKVPTSHLWVTGEHQLLVKYDWGELDLEYVLTDLVKGP